MSDPTRAAPLAAPRLDPSFDDDPAPGEVAVNGVDARTGGYAVRPLTPNVVSAIAEGRPLDAAELDELEERRHRAKAHLAVRHGVDAGDLAQAGWGVVFAADDPDADAAREALAPLLERRRAEAGERYREFAGEDGLRADETGSEFLARHGSAPGPVDPARGVPYYLLLVGSPARVGFEAQTDMDVRHAVGRLELDGTDALAEYAAAVVSREDRSAAEGAAARRLAVYATRNAGDVSTQRSARRLAAPVADAFAAAHAGWSVERHIGEGATKARLHALLHAPEPPALLFAAAHGAVTGADDPDQQAIQGALVTQEWPGPLAAGGPLDEGARFAAADLASGARLQGMIAMLFACFGAGTPAADEFLPPEATLVPALAPAPFTARLPQALLARGAGAVIGHVERAWTASFTWPGAGSVTTVFEDVLAMLAGGARVGAAVECLNQRYAEISVQLAEALHRRARGKKNQSEVAGLWLARTDARNYVILGDPAVRLPRSSTTA